MSLFNTARLANSPYGCDIPGQGRKSRATVRVMVRVRFDRVTGLGLRDGKMVRITVRFKWVKWLVLGF